MKTSAIFQKVISTDAKNKWETEKIQKVFLVCSGALASAADASNASQELTLKFDDGALIVDGASFGAVATMAEASSLDAPDGLDGR